ncbi:MAG: hypothetical protein QF363_13125 [Planctomycetaceae bacterium]|mgnify:CR=1 FL=1|nr:hypothetical protein [Planctomycetaceae bacterium]
MRRTAESLAVMVPGPDRNAPGRRCRAGRVRWGVLAVVLGMACLAMGVLMFQRYRETSLRLKRAGNPRREKIGRMTLWFDEMADDTINEWQTTGPHSNLRRQDYSDPKTCQRCHKKQFTAWQEHSHRGMNLLASPQTVSGDFSEKASIDYMGGEARFVRRGEAFEMVLDRDGQSRRYQVEETIGSRFFQYYVGMLVDGPDPAQHPMRHKRFVLPFGYWLDQKQWVPVVHVSEERADDVRDDPFSVSANAEDGKDYFSYTRHCAGCHSTFAFGDLLLKSFPRLGKYSPQSLHFSMPGYLEDAHPELWPQGDRSFDLSNRKMEDMMDAVHAWKAADHAVTMGISCGACHLGVKEHAEGRMKNPPFFPASPHLFVEYEDSEKRDDVDFGRTPANLNATCARCHAGKRPKFGGGMATWNSTEFSDALRGACFTKATCVHCHEPHTSIGPAWTRTPAQDDARCLSCHAHLADDELLKAHTHHRVGSSGSRCMNCHMPKINEGLQDVVRTHMIYSPTESSMIESNEPNACNLCHTDKPIDWTLQYLGEWYEASFNQKSIAFSYSPRDRPVALGWLKHRREAVRLVATDCLVRTKSTWALADLVEALDDDFLLNRQFASRGIAKLLGRSLAPSGYRFYMMRDERRGPLERIRREWLPGAEKEAVEDRGRK